MSPEQEMGRVDLWGHEKAPTAKERKEKLVAEKKLLSEIIDILNDYEMENITSDISEDLKEKSHKLLTRTSERIKDLRHVRVTTE